MVLSRIFEESAAEESNRNYCKSWRYNFLIDYGTHAPMQKMKDGKHYWDYQSVKQTMG